MSAQRGRHAESPTGIPARGWKDIGMRVWSEIDDDRAVLAAAGVAFWLFVALIPGLAAAISIYGLFADPTQVQQQLSQLMGNFPEAARQLVTQQLSRLAGVSRGALGWGTAISIGLALWTASTGMANLIKAMNVAYDEDEDRSFVVKRGVALLFTLGAIILFFAVAFAVGEVGPWLESLTASPTLVWLGRAVAWLIGGLLLISALAFLSKWGPKRADAEFEWVSVGSVVAVVLWVVASILFQIYVSNFGRYDQIYGSLGAVIVVLLWLFLSSFAVLLGAEINAEMEHQTEVDTTIGDDDPMGKRGAVMADTVGRTAKQLRDSG